MATKTKARSVKEQVKIVLDTFLAFGVEMRLLDVREGRNGVYLRLQTEKPARMKTIKAFEDDLCYALGVKTVEIQAPIRGTASIGINIHTEARAPGVPWKKIVSSKEFKDTTAYLAAPIGMDEFNAPVIVDIHKLKHILIAGTTGSGKSRLLNTIINSLLVRNSPKRLSLILVDTKPSVEFGLYRNLPHLLTPVLTDSKKMFLALKWLGKEMDRRYTILEAAKARDIEMYHRDVVKRAATKKSDAVPDAMPYIVMVIDELTHCMSTYPREMEAAIVKLTQMSCAVGIHLIVATRHARSKFLTGLIRANIPSRIVLQLADSLDSRAVLDSSGAEYLRGAGDALFLTSEMSEPLRIQISDITDTEISKHVKKIVRANPGEDDTRGLVPSELYWSENPGTIFTDEDTSDELYPQVVEAVREAGKVSTSFLQRKFRIGYSRSAHLVDLLEENGIIGPPDGASSRKVIDETE